jgi:hypothetical protein
VERIGAQDGLRRAGGGGPGDPVRAVGGQVGEQSGAFLAELVEECVHGAGLAAGRSPDQQPGVVVDHDDQVLVAALIGDLVDADAAQTASRSVAAPASPDTRAMMVPTVRQEIRISAVIMVFEHAAASQATWSSKNRVATPNAMGNFCFDVTLSYRRLELPRRVKDRS